MKLRTKEIVIFGMLGALMYASRILMAVLPNIHLLGTLITAVTIVYRFKALFPIYVYVFLEGLFSGFDVWWIPYLYIWTVLWGAVMLLPKNPNRKAAPFLYAGVSALHGLLFGILYSPVQALFYGMSFKTTVAWIVSGLPFDAIHCISNLLCGTLILPLVRLLRMIDKPKL